MLLPKFFDHKIPEAIALQDLNIPCYDRDIDAATNLNQWVGGQPDQYKNERQIRNTIEAIATINNAIPALDQEIAKFEAIGTPEALASAKVSIAAKTELENSLTDLEANLEKIKAIQKNSDTLSEKSPKFVEYHNKLPE